ncbi:hypothetical protein ACVOMV_26765 (plasmid) [Mesorhizobium atlanticum]|uniref:hypothetical protein n=1 Tax=Mesorhizobium atlanticum TaxID=2233532 RepID=UPI003703B1F1
MSRLIGFELQFGPFAVAQLRLIAELQALIKPDVTKPPKLPDLQLFVTDTLGNPYVEEDTLVQSGPIAQSRREANRIKQRRDITVVLGIHHTRKRRAGWAPGSSRAVERRVWSRPWTGGRRHRSGRSARTPST